MGSTNVDSRSIIKFATIQEERRPGKVNASGTLYLMHLPKKVTIKPTENVQIITQITV